MGDEFNGRVPQSSCIFLLNEFEFGQITIYDSFQKNSSLKENEWRMSGVN